MWTYLVLLAVILAILHALYQKNYFRIIKFIFTLDGPKTVPILGNADIVIKGNLLERIADEHQNYGRIIRIWLTFVPHVVLIEPEDIKILLQNEKHIAKASFYKLVDDFLGKGLITQDVDKWTVHRKILQLAFKPRMLQKFIETFGECADRLVDKLLEKDGEDINITTFVNNSVYDIVKETILGIPASQTYNDEEDKFRKNQFMITYRYARPWLLINWIYRLTAASRSEKQHHNELIDFCSKKMEEMHRSSQKNNFFNDPRTGKTSLLEFMIDYMINMNDPPITKQEAIEECCTFMLAGQESVATATAITLFYLARNLKWQKKCIEELNEIFGEDRRLPTIEDLTKMKNLKMFIKESLRLYPTVPLFARTLGEDMTVGEHVIPAGCNVIIMPYCTHRLPHHFPDPHDFKPERFSLENSKERHPFAYIPFSAGRRNCIGYKFAMLQMQSTISAILRKSQLEPVLGKENFLAKYRVTIRAHGGLWIRIKANDKYKPKQSYTSGTDF
ncbi:probable cytochrome P450 4aa1 [Solenopsis invicta]|uniref:probable cytochrome P450 4aa1 n=1 Tax=Solenopsis invicta TaxID=13686 RepID=UPI00193CBD93|nr:probable cytochrome P450 4aa1 [Solenopsis invicta]